jgi:hypothetical protein
MHEHNIELVAVSKVRAVRNSHIEERGMKRRSEREGPFVAFLLAQPACSYLAREFARRATPRSVRSLRSLVLTGITLECS